LIEAKLLAKREGRTLTEVICEALTEYVAARRGKRSLSFAGLGESGNPQLAQQTEEILTLDHRHFAMIRPAHREHFELLP
jgi:hypothetical protein